MHLFRAPSHSRDPICSSLVKDSLYRACLRFVMSLRLAAQPRRRFPATQSRAHTHATPVALPTRSHRLEASSYVVRFPAPLRRLLLRPAAARLVAQFVRDLRLKLRGFRRRRNVERMGRLGGLLEAVWRMWFSLAFENVRFC